MIKRAYLSIAVISAFIIGNASSHNKALAAENLIANPSFETQGSNGNPANWSKSGYGNNTRVFTYPVSGQNGGQAVQTEIKSYTSGDARWHFDEINVSGGEKYSYSQIYKSSVASGLTIRYQKEGINTYYYAWIANPKSASSWTTFTKEFTAPAGAKKMTIFILLKK